jgi:hypothetical protein
LSCTLCSSCRWRWSPMPGSPHTPRRLLEPDHYTPRTTSPSLYRHVVYMLCNKRNDKVQKHACMITNTMARIHNPRIKHSMDDDRSYISKSNIDHQGITSLGKLRFTHTCPTIVQKQH